MLKLVFMVDLKQETISLKRINRATIKVRVMYKILNEEIGL